MPPPGTAFPVPDPASFAAEPLSAEEAAVTDPAHIANTINVYAGVLVRHDLSAAVAAAAL